LWLPFFDFVKAAIRAHQIVQPTLIMAGEKDLPFILSVAHYLKSRIRGSTFALFHHSAHMINLEEPEKFEKTLLDILKKKVG